MANYSASELAGLRIRQARQQRGWTAKELADLCAKAGAPRVTATVVTNLETRRRSTRDISVDELLVLARVLEVPPVQLVLPLGADELLEVVPGTEMNAAEAVRWMGGAAEPLHYRELLSVRPEDTVRLLRQLEQDDVLNILRLADYAMRYIAYEDRALRRDPEREQPEWAPRRLHLLADRLMHLSARLEALGYGAPDLNPVREILERRGLPATLAEWRKQEADAEPPEFSEGESDGPRA